MRSSVPGSGQRSVTLLVGIGAVVVLSALLAASMLVGGGDISIERSWQFLTGEPAATADEHLNMVMHSLRFPRTLVAVVSGTALGVAGCLLQAATRNPLAETGLLGVNAGAALAVVIGITYLSMESAPALLVFALIGAFAASAAVLAISAGSRAQLSPLRLVLAGVALSATFRGATSYLLLSQAATYDRYRLWVLGSLSGVTLPQLNWVLPVVVCGLLIAGCMVRPLGALSLGDDVAAGLGHRPRRTRVAAATAVTLLTGAAVALCGPIAFLGLLAPYLARVVTGPRLGAQLLLSGVAGAVVMIGADVAARVVLAPYEAPVSVLLAVLGGPLLIVIVRYRGLLTLRVNGNVT
jgi:iron complex transport system permease protein